MKIVDARIRNFKLLRSIDLPFSIDREKPLTVIRAENGSGKTSSLQALRWALYGKDVLDDPLVRLSPADWPDKTPCSVSVEIDFVHSTVSNIDGVTMVSETSFMLKREVQEQPEGDLPNRGQERVTLYEKTGAGSAPIDAAESRLAQMLPKEMIDIFFTDGDAAMTFISPQLSDNTKRDKVKEAIRSLLGLDLLERVAKRVSDAQSAVNRQISKNASSDKLSEITEEIETVTASKSKSSEAIAMLNAQIEDVERKLGSVSRELTRALEAGSFEQLAHQRETYRNLLSTSLEEEEQLKRAHQELFQKESLSWSLIEPSLSKGYALLQGLHAQGVIPKAAVPVLEERLKLERCICGADLSQGSDAREHVAHLIEQQRSNDSQVDYLSSLYYQAKGELDKWQAEDSTPWLDDAKKLQGSRLAVSKRIENANRELKTAEAKLDQIDEEEIEQKRQHEKMLTSSLRQRNSELDRAEASLHTAESRLKELNSEQSKLRQVDQKMVNLNAEIAALDDLESVVGGALDSMQSTYLKRVSSRMNDLFLEMVGADPDHDTIFQGAEINERYNIVVRTKDNRTLNPEYEVNGASQRALTFAFIWALTEVSGVVAPRVIDTPLGMMSGNVKRRVLDMVTQPSGQEVDRQVVLFLTQSEISHTEDILDTRSGSTVTLTKSDDYPGDLVNDPDTGVSEVRICACSHREYCYQCQRTNHEDFGLRYRPA